MHSAQALPKLLQMDKSTTPSIAMLEWHHDAGQQLIDSQDLRETFFGGGKIIKKRKHFENMLFIFVFYFVRRFL